MSLKPVYDVIVIGAGAAGLAAARLLHDSGKQVLILEARERIGGRILTNTERFGFPVELGAEFIHGENAATQRLIEEAGLQLIPVPRKKQMWWNGQPMLALDETNRKLIRALEKAYAEMLEHFTGRDTSLADYFRSQGFDETALKIADVLFAQTCCASIETLSCADLVREALVDTAGTEEFRIVEGYERLLDWYQQGLAIELHQPVQVLNWLGEIIQIKTETQLFQAQQCIITIPVSLLQAKTIDFSPPLPPKKQAAIDAFRFEGGTKLLYQFDRPLWDDDLVYVLHEGLAARWWTVTYQRPDALPTIAAFLTAERAKVIDALSETEALALGLEELASLLGLELDTLKAHCTGQWRISWQADFYTRGAYASVPSGFASIRETLGQALDKKLFFAGEATAYDSNPQTVHGALESGWRAAREILAQ